MDGEGTRVVARVGEVLKAVAAWGDSGARLLDLANDTGIARPTVHRILHDLTDTGLIEQRAGRRYGLGPSAYVLGLAAPAPLPDMAAAQSVVQRLADDTTVTCYLGVLLVRRVYYLARAQGASPIHVHSVEVGATYSLPSTHAGIALLSTLDPAQRDRVLGSAVAETRTRRQTASPDTARIRQCVEGIQRRGFYCVHGLTVPGVSGMAAVVPAEPGIPAMAITLSTVSDYMTDERTEAMSRPLLAAANELGAISRGRCI